MTRILPGRLDGQARALAQAEVEGLASTVGARIRSVPMGGRSVVGAVLLVAAVSCPSAQAAGLDDVSDQWIPRSEGANWTYRWSDTQYSPTPRTEHYATQGRTGTAFRIRWTEDQTSPYDIPASGTMDFRHTDGGMVNLNYQSTPPPPQFPVLCGTTTECSNSVAGTYYMLIWGTRSPALAEPLFSRTRWTSLGGARNDVASVNRYAGRQVVVVPAFPQGIVAARVESEITQVGAVGDPYGSGVRTVWWVRGVGPVKVELHHVGGAIGRSELVETNLKPLPLPSQDALLPLASGDVLDYRWRNSRHMKRWSYQRFTVSEVANNTATVRVAHRKGPINVEGVYALATRLSGVTHVSGVTKAATRVRFPAMGPLSLPRAERRRIFTPFDLMVYGFGPIVPTYPTAGQTWRSSREDRDFKVFGVTGQTRIVGTRRVRVPAGRFDAVLVESRMTQRGFPFGSGRRRMWFVPGMGLVKLEFRHRDGSVSTVERLRG